jgi:hypothetical protein
MATGVVERQQNDAAAGWGMAVAQAVRRHQDAFVDFAPGGQALAVSPAVTR